jgi:hypothetical protein
VFFRLHLTSKLQAGHWPTVTRDRIRCSLSRLS